MNDSKIKEQLGRIKIYHARNDILKALETIITISEDTIKNPSLLSTEIRGLLRDRMQLILRDPLVQKKIPQNITYQPGQEAALLPILHDAHKKITAELEHESYVKTLERKQQLDRYFNTGSKLLQQGAVSEADTAFKNTFLYYKDEENLFPLIAKAFITNNEPIRAIDYIKKGLELCPTNKELQKLAAIINRIKNGDLSAINEI